MKKFKKVLLGLSLSFVLLFIVGIVSGAGYYYSVTHSVNLDTEKLENTKNATSLQIYDKNDTIINPSAENYITIDNLSNNTKNAFICAEDRRFYIHKGIDYIRVGGAVISNIKSHSFSEGASTISQQLVKNTQLTNEKTIKRKLKEFKLTRQLEKSYTKNDILEMYLNNIYFGNGCYGIENAANHYFGKSAEELSLSESALLAATINAPSVYDIQNNTSKAKERRDLILDLMQKYNKISENECQNAKLEEICLNITKLNNNYFVFDEIIEEACSILNKSETQLKNSNIKIYTYYDLELQNQINNNINENYSEIDSNPDIASIVVDNNTNGIVSITGKRSSFKSKKQPGSVIKPILVYAPAIEKGMISPATKLLDEKVDFGGYKPTNADGKFHGFVSARESLKNSYNIPAVKLLNELGIQEAQKFAKNLGIEFSKNDNNLAIALGGFTDGISLSEIINAYTSLANNGKFKKCKYISKIVKNNEIIYKNDNFRQNVMSDSTAYLITNMLTDTAKSGTAKRLKNLDYEIASKTGTVGLSNSSKNSDAFNVSYTSEHTILSHVGGTIMPESINGATYPTMITKSILNLLYADHKPSDFEVPNSVITQKISKSDYENNQIILTTDNNDFITEVFAKNNLPKQTKPTLQLTMSAFNFENRKPIISFFAYQNYTYEIIRISKEKEEIISSYNNLNKSEIIKFEDKSAKSDQIYEYYVKICDKNSSSTYNTNHVKLKSF